MKFDIHTTRLPTWESIDSVFKHALVEVVIFSFFVNILLLATPIYSLQIFDRISISRSYESLTMLLIAVIICVISLLCFEALRKSTLQQTSRKLATLLTQFAVRQEAKSATDAALSTCSSSASQQAFTTHQLDQMCRRIESPALLGLVDISLSPLFILLLFVLHPLFGTTMAIVNLLLLAVCAFQYRFSTSNKSDTSKQLKRSLKWFKDDYLSRWSQATEHHSSRRIDQLFSNQQSQKQRHAQVHQRWLLAIVSLRHLAQIAVPTVGGVLLITQEISMGVLLAAMILCMKSAIAWEQLFHHSATLAALLGDCKLLKIELFQAHQQNQVQKHYPAIPFAGTLHIELPSREKLTLDKGARMAIIGPCGSGKSSLLTSLIGLNHEGSPRLNTWYDEYSIATLNRTWLGDSIAFVRPARELPDGRVRRFLQSDAPKSNRDDERLIEVCQLIGLHARLVSLELSYDTDIDNEPYLQSSGVISLLLLARALIQDPDVVFIDDLDATLDKAGLEGFEKALDYLQRQQCSVIFTTQRKALISQCDHVLLNDNNRVYHLNPNPQSIGNPSTSISPMFQQGV